MFNGRGFAMSFNLLKRVNPRHEWKQVKEILRYGSKFHQWLVSLIAAVGVTLSHRGEELRVILKDREPGEAITRLTSSESGVEGREGGELLGGGAISLLQDRLDSSEERVLVVLSRESGCWRGFKEGLQGIEMPQQIPTIDG